MFDKFERFYNKEFHNGKSLNNLAYHNHKFAISILVKQEEKYHDRG